MSPSQTKQSKNNSTNSNSNTANTTASRICKHMNEDHTLSLFAMVKKKSNAHKHPKSKEKISHVKMTSIDLHEMKLSYVACCPNNLTCVPEEITIPFHPPLQSLGEARSRLVKMHHACLAPCFSWLYTDTTCQTILLSMAGLAYAHYFVDVENVLKGDAVLGPMVGEWGKGIAHAIRISWGFGVCAHVAEAIYAAFVCKTSLNMSLRNVLSWFLMISLVGYPMTSKVLEFHSIQKKHGSNGTSTSSAYDKNK